MDSSEEIGSIQFFEDLYNQYLKDPKSVDPSWRRYFGELAIEKIPSPSQLTQVSSNSEQKVAHLIEAYRTHGHLIAQINCIALSEPVLPEELHLERLGFSPSDRSKPFPTLGLLPTTNATLDEIVETLQAIYSKHLGVEYQDLRDPELKEWIRKRLEDPSFKETLSIDERKYILEGFTQSEFFESFLHTKYIGQKRFSLEGGETLIPMLGMILDHGAENGIMEIVLGMAHRGRLNVLGHILRKTYVEILNEFNEDYIPESFEGTGDVKYHKGYISESVETHSGKRVKVTLTPNPSHLESVDPVVEGQARSKQTADSKLNIKGILPILIHGDAALAGQGVVYETMQMSRLDGYATGGTVHIVINNQIGFTTWPKDSRSTHYCTDIARTFDCPVFHVNAEDPEICVMAAKMALEIRQRFHCDVFIDLNCYRKYGHNETDEPAFTQPLEYRLIRQKKSIRNLYRDQLLNSKAIDGAYADALESSVKEKLQKAFDEVQKRNEKAKYVDLMTLSDTASLFAPFPTHIPTDLIKSLAEKFCTPPPEFNLHPKIGHLLKERLNMAEGNKPIDWGMAEMLAYATLLWEGRPVRISGQDCCRGTFSHRHAMWIDQEKERAYYALKHLKEGQGRFDVINSLLSEMAVVGFEYGYSLGKPEGLTIWEAQFGDFCNGAQVIIDQFIASGEQKWGQKSNLTFFLPHGYEGQGPEHSSGRLERFLSLAGHNNMQVVYPTTPSQFFHLLRRQTLRPLHKPLIVFTPKALLRHSQCVSSVKDIAEGSFREIIDDRVEADEIKKLVFCTGKIYYDLLQERSKRNQNEIALIRIEQLYPLNESALSQIVRKYKNCKAYLWAQEEPKNMGAWKYIRAYLEDIVPKGLPLSYAGREISASPATGSHSRHKQELADILKQVFES